MGREDPAIDAKYDTRMHRRDTRWSEYHYGVQLVTDYVHPVPRGGRCRVRVYLPEEERDSPMVICSALPVNEGPSVTHFAERLAAEVVRYHRLQTPVVWIEHHPPEATDGCSETFELVVFASYQVKEKAPYMGEVRLTLGDAEWKPLERETVEAIVGGEV